MANICSTNIVIVGKRSILEKINAAIASHRVEVDTNNDWIGNILSELGLSCTENDWNIGGFISIPGEIQECEDKHTCILKIQSSDTGTQSCFTSILQKAYPDLKIYWEAYEPKEKYWATNDQQGNFFPNRWKVIVGTDVHNFKTNGDMWKFLEKNFSFRTPAQVDLYNKTNGLCNYIGYVACAVIE